jgi:hypothetical protein
MSFHDVISMASYWKKTGVENFEALGNFSLSPENSGPNFLTLGVSVFETGPVGF